MTTETGSGRCARADGGRHADHLPGDLRALIAAYVGVIVYLAGKAARGDDTRADSMFHSGKAGVAALRPGGVTADAA